LKIKECLLARKRRFQVRGQFERHQLLTHLEAEERSLERVRNKYPWERFKEIEERGFDFISGERVSKRQKYIKEFFD